MHFLLLALLAAGSATEKPKQTWWCPTGPCHLGFWIQCQTTEQDCKDLVQNTDQNAVNFIRPCAEKQTVFCLSYRPRGGDGYGPAETYCHDTLKHCQVDERDVKKNGKYKELKSCAKK